MKKNLRKKFSILVFSVILGAIVAGECFLIKKMDENYQYERTNEIYTDIATSFYLIKTSILSQDYDSYVSELPKIDMNIQRIEQYDYVREHDSDKIEKIQAYQRLLVGKKNAMEDIAKLGQFNKKILDFVESKLDAGVSDIGKNDLLGLAGQIKELKGGDLELKDENVKKEYSAVVSGLDFMAGVTEQLANCYNVCYSGEIKTKVDSVQGEINRIKSEISNNNDAIRSLFDLNTLDDVLKLINNNL